jgi:hypothetical protein
MQEKQEKLANKTFWFFCFLFLLIAVSALLSYKKYIIEADFPIYTLKKELPNQSIIDLLKP